MLSKSCYDTKHSLTFEFKENKIKFQLTGLQLYSAPNKYAAGGWSDANPDFNFLYKKNGKPRKNQIEFAEGFTSLLNRLQKNFMNYLNNPIKEQKSKSDW